jgi:hypothetical protein
MSYLGKGAVGNEADRNFWRTQFATLISAIPPIFPPPATHCVWVLSVESLHERVQAMLRDSIASQDVTVRRFDTNVTEDFIGTYSIPALEITVGNERVEFLPKGVITGNSIWLRRRELVRGR